MDKEHQVPIWFFIGGILAIYGLLILGAGLYALSHPPEGLVLSNLHADIWWGALLILVGSIYLAKFCPCRKRSEADSQPPGSQDDRG